MRNVDRNGEETSTHTDQYGHVVAVYNDGDLGVYKHLEGEGDTLKDWIDAKHSPTNTSAGGLKMGESLQMLSFTTIKDGVVQADEKMTIDYGSTALTDAVQEIIDANPSIGQYMKKAQMGGAWDLKKQPQFQYGEKGSLLFGKYASPRDAGNFAAGYFSASTGIMSPVIDFGYGFYNISDNNTTRTIINAAYFVLMPVPLPIKYEAASLIEISRISQSIGRQYYRRQKQ